MAMYHLVLMPFRLSRALQPLFICCLSGLAFCSFVAAQKCAAASQRSFNFSAPATIVESDCDLHSQQLSPAAVQLAHTLGLDQKLKRLGELQSQSRQHLSVEDHLELNDLKLELLQQLEQARLEIDFVGAEIEMEVAGLSELLQAYSADRDNRINRANAWGFKTNGILWATAESLSIPTYRYPRLSISSGTIGIIAGLVPSMFSMYALREATGKRFERKLYPNMLTKIYDRPVTLRTEFPESVWTYLNSPPSGETRTRREILVTHWREDKNIHIFDKGGLNDTKISLLTGAGSNGVNIDLINDRLTMLREVKAVVMQINRPLLELLLVMEGKKSCERMSHEQ